MGFEDEEEGDFIVPRIKVIQSLSPERKEKLADEGDIINSLTKENLVGKVFVPVYKFTNIIKWRDRADGGGMEAMSRDGKIMIPTNGDAPYPVGMLADFDNSKQGRDAIPTHVRYMNFFGFFEGDPMPIILSFSKTNYNEGKRLYSLAKVTMQNMWNHGYKLEPKLVSKGGNEWYIINPTMAGATSDEDRQFGMNLFNQFRNAADLKFDVEDNTKSADEVGPSMTDKAATDAAEF
jgi:hypothetical protein